MNWKTEIKKTACLFSLLAFAGAIGCAIGRDSGIETGRRIERELYETTPDYTWTAVARKRNAPEEPPLVIEFNIRDMKDFYKGDGKFTTPEKREGR